MHVYTAQRLKVLCLVSKQSSALGAWIYCYVMLPRGALFHWMKVFTSGCCVTMHLRALRASGLFGPVHRASVFSRECERFAKDANVAKMAKSNIRSLGSKSSPNMPGVNVSNIPQTL